MSCGEVSGKKTKAKTRSMERDGLAPLARGGAEKAEESMSILCHRYLLAPNAQHPFVFVGEHLDELGQHVLPVFQHPLAPRAGRGIHVAVDDGVEPVSYTHLTLPTNREV